LKKEKKEKKKKEKKNFSFDLVYFSELVCHILEYLPPQIFALID